MITRNDARVTNLSNGDIGLVVKDGLVWFPGKTVAIPFNQLPTNTPAFATTIHKSQGSEYSFVLLVLPKPDKDDEDDREKFINKQLVFTGITRAKDHLTVFSTSETLYDALDESADRASGLDKRLR
jgi:exodeoxyribonuclease V alpha subunit